MTDLLKHLKNPSKEKYQIQINVPELTFLGVEKQPDFAILDMIMFPSKKIIELKSLKQYFYSFRDQIVSYERLINTIYSDIMETYNPDHLIIEMKTTPRGGISSKLKIDSEWR